MKRKEGMEYGTGSARIIEGLISTQQHIQCSEREIRTAWTALLEVRRSGGDRD